MTDRRLAIRDGATADKRVAVVQRVMQQQRINCTGPGEVGCYARKGWHSWYDHELHIAEAIVEALDGDEKPELGR